MKKRKSFSHKEEADATAASENKEQGKDSKFNVFSKLDASNEINPSVPQIPVSLPTEESDYLGSGKVSKKKRIKAQKYLADMRKDLDLSSKKLTSQLSLRIKQQQMIRANINQKNGVDLESLIHKDLQIRGKANILDGPSGPSQSSSQRQNRFLDQNIEQGPRSLSQEMSTEGLRKYKQVQDKMIRRERSSLSHTRYNKMKQLILKEVSDAIQEAEHEPSASIADFNQLQSVIM